jgi:hypothetical protein
LTTKPLLCTTKLSFCGIKRLLYNIKQLIVNIFKRRIPMSDFVPRPDTTFDVWQGNLLNKAETAVLRTKQSRWAGAFKAAGDPETRTKASVREKQEAREEYESALREFVKAWLTYNPAMTDADRENFGLPVHDTKPTPASEIKSRPEVEVGFKDIQKHTLALRVELHGSGVGTAGLLPCPLDEHARRARSLERNRKRHHCVTDRESDQVILKTNLCGSLCNFFCHTEGHREFYSSIYTYYL